MTANPKVIVEGGKVYFGEWYLSLLINRGTDIRSGEPDLGLEIRIGGGCSSAGTDWRKELSALLSEPGSSIDYKTAGQIEARVAQRLAPVAERFMRELVEELDKAAKDEAAKLSLSGD